MKIQFTKAEKKILKHASQTCSCESYSSYRCPKCREKSTELLLDDNEEIMNSLKDQGLVYWDVYHGLSLTDTGYDIFILSFPDDARYARKIRNKQPTRWN